MVCWYNQSISSGWRLSAETSVTDVVRVAAVLPGLLLAVAAVVAVAAVAAVATVAGTSVLGLGDGASVGAVVLHAVVSGCTRAASSMSLLSPGRFAAVVAAGALASVVRAAAARPLLTVNS